MKRTLTQKDREIIAVLADLRHDIEVANVHRQSVRSGLAERIYNEQLEDELRAVDMTITLARTGKIPRHEVNRELGLVTHRKSRRHLKAYLRASYVAKAGDMM